MILRLRYCTRSRGRTGTTLLSLGFETNASTDSAIRANRLQRRIGRTKIGINSQFAIPNTQLFQSKPKKAKERGDRSQDHGCACSKKDSSLRSE